MLFPDGKAHEHVITRVNTQNCSSSPISAESIKWRTKHRGNSGPHGMKHSAAGLQRARAWTLATLMQNINAIIVYFSPARLGVFGRYWVQNRQNWARNRGNYCASHITHVIWQSFPPGLIYPTSQLNAYAVLLCYSLSFYLKLHFTKLPASGAVREYQFCDMILTLTSTSSSSSSSSSRLTIVSPWHSITHHHSGVGRSPSLLLWF